MKEIVRRKLLRQSYTSFINKCHAIILIYGDDNTYEIAKADELFAGKIPKSGSLTTLYKSIFLQTMEDDSSVDDKYNSFIDISLFKQGNYHDYIILPGEKDKITLEYRILQINKNIFSLYFLDNSENLEMQISGQQKLDILSEKYLFSMMVDLKNDICKNTNISELAGKHHDYLDITYSQWRFMITDMFLPSDKVTFLSVSEPDHIIDMLEKAPCFSYEIQMRNLQGEYIWVRLSFTRVSDFSRKNPVFVYTVEDIHKDMMRLLQQQNIISAVEQQNKELQCAHSDQSGMISSISHEIRTPLNAILGMDEIILREAKDPSIISYAKDIQNAGKHLLHIVNDVLDYNRLTAGKIEIFPEAYSVSSMVNDVFAITSVLAREKDLSLEFDIDSSMPKQLYGDSMRIKQIIINLLSNAIKYTKKGTVTLSMEYSSSDNLSGTLSVKVKDTGVGIAPENMDKLFASYERIDEEKHTDIPGSGLGMSIVISLLELMDSKLEVESIKGEGSTFSFGIIQSLPDLEIPATISENEDDKTESKTPSSLSLSGNRILVIDDMRTNLIIVKELLKDTGALVDIASDGQEGLSMISASRYDLILLDDLMPEMSGVDTLREIGKLGPSFSDIPIIALTANITSDAKSRYKEAGFRDLLEKPIDVDSLEQILRTYLL
ncbi:MAG: ATP-binding protein [Lachnospiraceae bacterium]|nr:ATP-binding protein [Lachnospiraceae bacterium]